MNRHTIQQRAHNVITEIQQLSLPGFEGVSIHDVVLFVFHGLRKGSLVIRASSIAFNLLFAILPSTIFLFTLIPFIPIRNFQSELLQLIEIILPGNVYSFLKVAIVEVITEKSGGLLLLMFGATLLFSSNGVHALYHAFNASIHELPRRKWLNQRTMAVLLVFIITMMLTGAVILLSLGQLAVQKLVDLDIIRLTLTYYILYFGKWVIMLVLVFLTISFLYYLAPPARVKWRFISAGSTLATLLFFLSSLGFSYFVNHFGRFNSLYGSIGTLIVILILLYFNSISLLIGYEMNACIKSANQKNVIVEQIVLP
jgi:membrane protein